MAGWVLKAKSPYGRNIHYASLARVGTKIYVTGGSGANGQCTNTMIIYDIVSDTWSSGAPMHSAREYHESVAVGTKIYVIGGRDSTNASAPTEIYDTVSGVWSFGSNMLYPGKSDFGCAAIGDKIYVIGGYGNERNSEELGKEILIYHTATDVWTKSATVLPERQAGLACVGKENVIYCLGGLHGYNTYQFDTVTGKIDSLASVQNQMESFGADLYVDDIYCVGWSFKSTEIYNIPNNYWRLGLPHPTANGISARKCSVYQGFLYATYSDDSNKLGIMSLDLRTATLSNPQPSAGFVNEQADNTFSWELESAPTTAQQKSAQFQWRQTGSATVHTINIAGPETLVTVPANTFPNGSFQWRVKATNTLDITSDWTDWFTLTTIDEPPLKPTGLYPNSGVRPGTSPIQFSWIHRSPLGTPQSAFEMQVTYNDGASWINLIGKINTQNTSYTVAANTLTPLAGGKVGWRVRTYNSDNVASPWADAVYIEVRTAPQTPTWRSVEAGKSRPMCQWVAPDQIAYQLQVIDPTSGAEVVVYDSETIFSADTSHNVATYLPNRTYTFRVRIQNGTIGQDGVGLWSDWATRAVFLSAPKRLKITLDGEQIPNGARLTFDVEVVT